MNILFATLVDINNIDERGIYQDLMREIASMGHNVYIVSPTERRHNKPTSIYSCGAALILKVRVGNIVKTNRIEKGIATVLLEYQFVRAVRKYLPEVRFDLVLYSTPPITLVKLVKYIKKRDDASSYLLLKDIFPQNAVDLGFFSRGGLLHRIFRKKERELYAVSDHIGCMSPANAAYLLAQNKGLDTSKTHVNPNSIIPLPLNYNGDREAKRTKYGIPANSRVFMYGGSLGKPQSVPFIIECMKLNQNKDDRFFVICGDGTDAHLLSSYIKEESPKNIKLMKLLPKDDYDDLLSLCDIGLIFLDCRFTIPNFPSRLLTYMEQCQPVLACTDPNTDIGKTITDNGFGWWCESNDPARFTELIDEICTLDAESLRERGLRGRQYLEENYLASQSAKIIMEHAIKS